MSVEKFKKQAKLLVKRSKEMELKLSHQQSLELIATLNGFQTWNALIASEDKNEKKELMKESIYFRLDYFYDRKNSGSFYVEFNRNEYNLELKESRGDIESAVLNLALKTSKIDREDSRSITDVEEISEDDYREVMG